MRILFARLLVILAVVGTLAPPFAVRAEDMVLEVIPLKHRLAQDVIPVLQPLVSGGGTITGMNEQLIVKTTPSNLDQIKQVLESIDRAPRRLRISVRQDVGESLEAREDALSAQVRSGNVRATLPGGTGGGAAVTVRGGDNAVRYETLSTRATEDNFNAHFVQGIEGQPAWIETGQSVPVPNRDVFVGPGGAVVRDGIEYRDVNSGFYVVPRLNGEQVMMEIYPQLNRVNPQGAGVIDTQQAYSTAAGRLGEWINLGGAAQNFQRRDNANVTSTRSTGAETHEIWVKVDEIP